MNTYYGISNTLYIIYVHFLDTLLIDVPLGCLHVLAVVDNAVMNMAVYVSLWDRDLIPFKHTYLEVALFDYVFNNYEEPLCCFF